LTEIAPISFSLPINFHLTYCVYKADTERPLSTLNTL